MKQTLHDNWQFEYNNDWLSATIPGTIHTDLLSNNIIEDPFFGENEKLYQWIDKRDWKYRTSFNTTKEMLNNDKVFLLFEGLDTYSEIKLNGSVIGKTDNMFIEHEIEVKKLLKNDNNQLEIIFYSPIIKDMEKVKALGYSLPATNDNSQLGGVWDNKLSVFTRKAPYHYGWDWGPRFVTCGVFMPVYLKGVSKARINNVYYHQKNIELEKAEIDVYVEIESFSNQNLDYELSINGLTVHKENIDLTDGINNIQFTQIIENPNLWWPNRLGGQYLYNFKLILSNGCVQEEKIGLRKIELIRQKDNFGESFMFKVNGHEVFMKGANHIPNDNFISQVTYDRYQREILSAKKSNLNMLRVWGGGFYEKQEFYDLCDEHGILVWQDFMFACSMYPSDDEFIQNISNEAEFNIKRLRNKTCLALWCGNNEIDSAWCANYGHGWGWKKEFNLEQQKKITEGYNKIFYNVLANKVKTLDLNTYYWSSSPWTGNEKIHSCYSSGYGDMHFWGVWHNDLPYSDFGKYIGRFISEYGMQSFPEIETLETIASKEEINLLSNTMLSHQKSGVGNQKIKHYLSEYFEETEDFRRIVHLSQLSQGEAMRYAIETHRCHKPFCMGSLYWQMNDTWQGPSWSTLDYFGKWKASQYLIKEASKDVILFIKENDNLLEVSAASDILQDIECKYTVKLKSLDNKVLWEEEYDYTVEANVSKFIKAYSREGVLQNHSENDVYLYFTLKGENINYSRIYFFNKFYNIQFRKPKIQMSITDNKDGYEIKVKSNEFTKYFALQTNLSGYFNKNHFDLEKDVEYSIVFETKGMAKIEDFKVLSYN